MRGVRNTTVRPAQCQLIAQSSARYPNMYVKFRRMMLMGPNATAMASAQRIGCHHGSTDAKTNDVSTTRTLVVSDVNLRAALGFRILRHAAIGSTLGGYLNRPVQSAAPGPEAPVQKRLGDVAEFKWLIGKQYDKIRRLRAPNRRRAVKLNSTEAIYALQQQRHWKRRWRDQPSRHVRLALIRQESILVEHRGALRTGLRTTAPDKVAKIGPAALAWPSFAHRVPTAQSPGVIRYQDQAGWTISIIWVPITPIMRSTKPC
jgi:hypothetical protein